MANAITLLLVAVVLIYVIGRQFTEQRVTPLTLLLLPVLSAHASYLDLWMAWSRFAPFPLVTGVASGALLGIATGLFRGQHTRLRLDHASGVLYSKPELASSVMWLAVLVARIAVVALRYSLVRQSTLTDVLIACGGTMFLLSISTQKLLVFLRSRQIRAAAPRQA